MQTAISAACATAASAPSSPTAPSGAASAAGAGFVDELLKLMAAAASMDAPTPDAKATSEPALGTDEQCNAPALTSGLSDKPASLPGPSDNTTAAVPAVSPPLAGPSSSQLADEVPAGTSDAGDVSLVRRDGTRTSTSARTERHRAATDNSMLPLAATFPTQNEQAPSMLPVQGPAVHVTGTDAGSTAPSVSSKAADVSISGPAAAPPARANPAPTAAMAPVKDDQAQPVMPRPDPPAHVASAGAKSTVAVPDSGKSAEASNSEPAATPPNPANTALVTSTQHIDPSALLQSASMSPSAAAPALSAVAVASTTTTATHAASPAAQITPPLVQFAHTADSGQRLTIRLEPPELGQVEVRIDRPHESPARVEITVEKTETLTLLLRDQPQLQRALDQAGIPSEGRSVTFHVASPEQRSGEPSTAPAPGVAAGGAGGDASQGAPRDHGKARRQQGAATDGGDTGLVAVSFAGWARAGLDITA